MIKMVQSVYNSLTSDIMIIEKNPAIIAIEGVT